MEKRSARRWPRQLEARFWKRGDDTCNRGMVTNISFTGAYLRSGVIVPPGTRLRIEALHGGQSVVFEGVVVRALRSPIHLQQVRPSGMGVRFLEPAELVAELIPTLVGAAAPATAATRTEIDDPRPLEPPRAAEELPPPEPGAPVLQPPPPRRRSPAKSEAPPTLSLRFLSAAELTTVLERDVRTGGIFVPTATPPPLQALVSVDVSVADSRSPAVRLEGRVVHRVVPNDDDPPGSPNLLVGAGIQLADAERAVRSLHALLG